SVGIISASQGTYSPGQLQLDVTQGARIASSAYRRPMPPPLSLEGRRVSGWAAAAARAAAAPQELTPGLLASSVPGGAAYASAQPLGAVVGTPGEPPALITTADELERS